MLGFGVYPTSILVFACSKLPSYREEKLRFVRFPCFGVDSIIAPQFAKGEVAHYRRLIAGSQSLQGARTDILGPLDPVRTLSQHLSLRPLYPKYFMELRFSTFSRNCSRVLKQLDSLVFHDALGVTVVDGQVSSGVHDF